MASVAYDHASRTYPGNPKPSVDQLNLEIADGEFLVLVGPSGCGKSTALRMLAGLEDINAGRILIGGRDVTRVPPKDRDIAMVFQNYALYPHMTVAENMSFGLRLRSRAWTWRSGTASSWCWWVRPAVGSPRRCGCWPGSSRWTRGPSSSTTAT